MPVLRSSDVQWVEFCTEEGQTIDNLEFHLLKDEEVPVEVGELLVSIVARVNISKDLVCNPSSKVIKRIRIVHHDFSVVHPDEALDSNVGAVELEGITVAVDLSVLRSALNVEADCYVVKSVVGQG